MKEVKQVQDVRKVREIKKVGRFTVPVVGIDGIKKGVVTLPKEIFGIKDGEVALASYIRVFRSNQRSARARVKTRASVNRTKAKIYRQKGTGKARHGSRSAPIYVGGGVAHGPRGEENYKFSLPKAIRRKALLVALSLKFAGGVLIVADIDEVEPKTKLVSAFLKRSMGTFETAIVHGGSRSLIQAARNIAGVNLVNGKTVGAYDVLFAKRVVLTKEGLGELKGRFRL